MAIFGEHIKGVNHETISSYTGLQGGTPNRPAPVLCVSRSNDYETAQRANYGELALAGPNPSTSTRESLSQNIYTHWYIQKNITFESECRLTSKATGNTWHKDVSVGFLKFVPKTGTMETDELQGGNSQIRTIYQGTVHNAPTLQNHYSHQFNGAVGFSNQVSMKEDLIVDKKVEALYFNARSDKRAKENLCVYTDSALDIINRVQVYTFNYRHHDKRTVGLLAQDLLDYKLNGVCLVDNIDATGIDNDYMTINESKLVYVLGKAIQEQQVLINQLTERIKKLEN